MKETLNPVIDGNISAIKKSGEGMGKSGSFFFFSHDKKLLIKTMTTDDFNAWVELFPKYFQHINMFEDSLIARVYGIYSVQMEDMQRQHLILMGSTALTKDGHVKKVYDLKGSIVKRYNHGDESKPTQREKEA